MSPDPRDEPFAYKTESTTKDCFVFICNLGGCCFLPVGCLSCSKFVERERKMSEVVRTVVSSRPREVSGGWTSERYAYQRNFSILLLVQLHENEADYRILFDYFDDVVTLDGSIEPKKISFYQVKTRDDRIWRMADISGKTGSRRPTSIISKMYDNFLLFHPHVKSVVFVSNMGFDFSMASGGSSGAQTLRIAATDLSGVELSRITAALDRDFQPARPDHKPFLSFWRCELGLLGQYEHVLGRLSRYFQSNGGAEHVPVQQVYDALLSEVTRKSGPFNGFGAGGVDDLYRAKSMARREISDLFSRAMTARRLDDHWSDIQEELKEAGLQTLDRIDVKKFSYCYVADRAAGKSTEVRFSKVVSKIMSGNRGDMASDRTIVGRVRALTSLCEAYGDCPFSGLRLTAALLVHVLEDQFDNREDPRAEAAA